MVRVSRFESSETTHHSDESLVIRIIKQVWSQIESVGSEIHRWIGGETIATVTLVNVTQSLGSNQSDCIRQRAH